MQRRFYIQCIAVLLTAGAMASLYYYATCAGLRQSRSGVPGKLNRIIDDTTHYDAVFVGSSRVSRNIDPTLFRQKTGYASFNAGVDGANLTVMTFLAKAFIRQHHPRFVFINLDTYTMEDDSSIFYYPQYLPYAQTEGMEVMASVEPRLGSSRFAPFVAISYLNDDLKRIAVDQWIRKQPYGDEVYRAEGYEAIHSDEYKGGTDSLRLPFEFDTVNFKKLATLCAFCREYSCQVFFIMAPIRGYVNDETPNHTDYYRRLKAIGARYNVVSLNYYGDARFGRNDFYNDTHLNYKGAELYTTLLADTLLAIGSGPGASIP